MGEKYYKIDFHVHTPSSYCYEGDDDDSTYINIIQRAIDNEIDIIAITDHNTISGYEKIITIKEDLKKRIEILSEYSESDSKIKEDIKNINQKIKLFDGITILPGVEITLNPGIHMIVISNSNETSDLSKLLDYAGYAASGRGYDSEITPSVDVQKFLEHSLLQSKIVIAPHVDSDNGIYNDLPKGYYRAAIFQSEIITAITCNNPKTLKKIQHLTSNEPAYKRISPLAYINSSDSHKIDSIGNKVSYLKLSKRTFDEIKKAFLNPAENISDIKDPSLSNIINRIIDSEKTLVIEQLEKDSNELFAQNICACINNSFRYIIIGVDLKTKDLIGVKINSEELKEMFFEAMNLIRSQAVYFQNSFRTEELGNGRYVGIISLITDTSSLWYMNNTNDVFIYDKELKKANIREIESLVKNNILEELSYYENKSNVQIENVIGSLKTLKSPIEKYKLIQKITLKNKMLLSVLSIKAIQKSNNPNFWNSYNDQNGEATGNIYYAYSYPVRLENCVLRYSCPRIDEPIESFESKIEEISTPSIIITKQGGTICVNQENWLFESVEDVSWILTVREKYEKKYSILSLLAWFKSSVFIWYLLIKFGDTNIIHGDKLDLLPIPDLKIMEPGNIIEKSVENIFQLEESFLKELNTLLDKKCDLDTFNKEAGSLCENHNNEINRIATEIDSLFIDSLGLNKDEVQTISSDLSSSKIHNIL